MPFNDFECVPLNSAMYICVYIYEYILVSTLINIINRIFIYFLIEKDDIIIIISPIKFNLGVGLYFLRLLIFILMIL